MYLWWACEALQQLAPASLFSPGPGHSPTHSPPGHTDRLLSVPSSCPAPLPTGALHMLFPTPGITSSLFSFLCVFSNTNSDLILKVVCFGKPSLTSLTRSNPPSIGSVNSTYLSIETLRKIIIFYLLVQWSSAYLHISSVSTLWELVRSADSSTHPRPTEPETLGMGPGNPHFTNCLDHSSIHAF